jgi:tetratricopeptide (TPR) repeat protein
LRIEQLISPFLAPIRALEALAQALAAEGRYNEARVCCDLLMAEDGNNLAALMAMATITSEQDHDLAAAENYYLRALASHFTDLDVHRNWMLHLVRAGDYERARRHFVDFFLKDPRRMPSVTGTPLPDHADLKEKKLLLVGRPGFGDYFQLLRFASFFHDRGAHVSVECVESLWDLLRTIPGIDGFTEEGAESTEFDYQADTWSVFLYFEDCLKLAEQRVPYILPPSSLADRWRSRLQQPDSVLKVGLAWSSSLASRNAHTCRNVPIRALDGLSRAANVKYYSLQFTSVKGSVGESGLQMINLAPELSPFIETAGAFVNLDLIVTVDSSVAHLAGALGTPTYVLLPYAPDPRWMLDGDTTPWYPATRLFRQTVPGDWSRPISQIAAAIEELAVARLRNLQMDNLAVTLR